MTCKTQERILDVAEKLFSEQGISATSLRNITEAADANLAAVNYHFGSKEGLVSAVLTRLFEPVNTLRMENLKRLKDEYAGRNIPLDPLLEAFLNPIIDATPKCSKRRFTMFKLIARLHLESEEITVIALDQMKDIALLYIMEMEKTLPHLSRKELFIRFKFSLGSLISCLMPPPDKVREHCPDIAAATIEEILKELIIYTRAGFLAPAQEK